MTSLLSDEMLRQLIAVGQADIVVGIPTLNHAGAIVGIADTVTGAFRSHFPQARAVLVNVDGGSEDGTPELILDPGRGSRNGGSAGGLRTVHRVSARYPGLVSRAKEIQVVFAANELVRARALAIIDPDCHVSQDSVAALLRPILEAPCDFVTPIYARGWSEGALITQLLRPAIRGIYRRALAEPAAGEWACSARFAGDRLTGALWDTDLGTAGVSLWLVAEALAGDYEPRQVPLGLRPTPIRAMHSGLPDVFAQIVGALFRSVDLHAAHWADAGDVAEVPALGPANPPHEVGEIPAVEPLVRTFRSGMRDLEPVLQTILRPGTWTALREMAEHGDPVPRFEDELWVTVVYEFVAAYHRGPMHRDHLIQALVAPYLGRTASFLATHASMSPADAAASLEALGLEFERGKPHLSECWNSGGTP